MKLKRMFTSLALTTTLISGINSTSLGANMALPSRTNVSIQELANGYNYFNSNTLSGIKMTLVGNNNSQLILEPVGANKAVGVIVEGSFEIPAQIWKDKWLKYNTSPAMKLDNVMTNEVLGVYLLQPFKINKAPVFKQPSGKNYIWFGDLCNPYDSFDAWYIGEYPAKPVPRTKPAIPLIPTFIPNTAHTNMDYIHQPWLAQQSEGIPHLKKTLFEISHFYRFSKEDAFIPLTSKITNEVTQTQLNSLELITRYSSGDSLDSANEHVSIELEKLFFKEVKKVNEGIRLIWNSYENYLYDISRTPDLGSAYINIGTNIPGKYSETEFIDKSPLSSGGFYQLKGEKITP